MEWKPIPATNDEMGEAYLKSVTVLRDLIIDSIDAHGENAHPDVVESTLDTILSKSRLDVFGTWHEQKPKLEEILIQHFIEVIVFLNMEQERQKNHRYQYSVATEGRCLEEHHRDNPYGFIKIEKPIPNTDENERPKLYTYNDLVNDWRNIFVLDTKIESDQKLREKYAPKCKQHKKKGPVDALILTTQHQLRIVDEDGKYVEGTNISFCRVKSGVGYLPKKAEFLTGRRADGTPRVSIDDTLAELSREHEYYNGIGRWVKAIRLIGIVISEMEHETMDDVIKLKGYSQKEAYELRKVLENLHDIDRDIGGLIKRPDLEFIPEPLPEGKKGKFAEIWLPYKGNKTCWQVYHDLGEDSYAQMLGDEKSIHVKYRIEKEENMLKGFTPWHWSIIRRLAPYFLSEYHQDPMGKIYEPYLNLDVFRKPSQVISSQH